jgi:hypothetical protein
VTLATIKTSCQWNRELSDETVVRDTEVSKFECEADEMGDAAWRQLDFGQC